MVLELKERREIVFVREDFRKFYIKISYFYLFLVNVNYNGKILR